MDAGKETTTPLSAAASSGAAGFASSSTATLASSSAPNNAPILGKALNTALTVKLNESNFILWKTLVEVVLRGQRLDGFISGTKAAPPEIIAVTNKENAATEISINPEFEEWTTIDQALLGWLLMSMEPSIATDIISHKSSRAVWKALEGRFGAANKARINHLRQSLQTTRKGSMSMVEYLAAMKQITDGLNLAGEPVGERYLVSSVLAGLDAEYLPVVCQLNSLEGSWESVHATLIAFEQTLAHLNIIPNTNELANATANLSIQRQNSNSSNINSNSRNNSGYQGGRSGNRGNFRGGRSRGRGGRHNGPRLICQLCGKSGHSGPYCYNRYDPKYMGSSPDPSPENNNNRGHSAFVAGPETINDLSWYADSGATNHVTNDQGTLTQSTDYRGSNQGTGNLSLQGWPSTLSSGLLQQPESLIQFPQAYNQLHFQDQLMLQAAQNLGMPSSDELTCLRPGVPPNNQNINIGKDNQSKFINASNVESLVPVCYPVLPHVDADMPIKNPVSSEHSQNSNHQIQQRDKLNNAGIINADDCTSNSFQGNDQADMDDFMDDGAIAEVESLFPEESDLRDEADLSSDAYKGPIFKEIRLIPAGNDKVVCCRFSSDGKLLASGGHDKKATVWCTESFTLKSTFDDHSQWITDVCFSPRTSKVATSSGDKTVKVWDMDNPGHSLRTFTGHLASITSLDSHPSKDDLICSCDTSSEIRYWSIKNGSCVGIFKGGAAQLRFQPNNGRILAAAMGNYVSIIDVETQVCRLKLQGHTNYIRSVCWDPSGEYLASVSDDLAKVWKVGSGGKADCIHEFNCNKSKFHSSVFHPTCPSRLIISSYKSLELWDMVAKKTRTMHAHDGLVSAVTASNVTGLVASASYDKCVKLWQ